MQKKFVQLCRERHVLKRQTHAVVCCVVALQSRVIDARCAQQQLLKFAKNRNHRNMSALLFSFFSLFSATAALPTKGFWPEDITFTKVAATSEQHTLGYTVKAD